MFYLMAWETFCGCLSLLMSWHGRWVCGWARVGNLPSMLMTVEVEAENEDDRCG